MGVQSSPMKKSLHCIRSIKSVFKQIIFLLILLAAAKIVYAAPLAKSVLYLNSYHDGYRWSDSELRGIRAELLESDYKVDLQIEYMDAKRFDDEAVTRNLFELYKTKFRWETFDVVMVSDDDAFNFALEYRSVLFPDVPIVFCGVNDLSGDDLRKRNITGVVETFDLVGTIDIALKLHPEKKKMVVIGDTSTAGAGIKRQIEELVPVFKERLQVEYWVEFDLDEVQRRVGALPEDTFLFFIPYYQVIGDFFYTAEEVMEAIYSHSSVPIYTSWEFLLDHGAVGGSLLSGFDHGREAAKMAVQIFNGVDADVIPVHLKPEGVYRFDYEVMQKLKIPEKMLPEGSKLINAPNPFYELPRELFWTIIISFFILLAVLLSLVFNMVARRKVEWRIKEQLRFQETLIDTIPLLVSWKDVQGAYVGANRAFAGFFGVEEVSELYKKKTRDVVADRVYEHWSEGADEDVVRKNKSFRKVRKRILDPKGEESWLDVHKAALRDQDGKITGVLTVAENVTRENNLEKQLLQSQKMEAIGTLAGGIAHDFNNILTSIINSTELAIGDVPIGSQTEKDLERVLKAARRGGRVVKQILAFSRPSQEGFRATNLKDVITEVITLLEVSMPGNVKIRSYIAPGLNEVQADPTQIHQALMNLCTNSFQELRETGGFIQLRLELETLGTTDAGYLDLQPGSFIKISVIDDGPGIAPDIIDKIFDPFFTSKDKTEGTGLGLTVVHGIVKGHGGSLRVKSEFGKGTIFEIFLPKIDSVQDLEKEQAEIEQVNGGKVLFVEDDLDQLQTAERILAGIGFDVEAISDSSEAAAKVAVDTHFDLMITDYDMPGLNGVELVKMVRRWAPELPVIIVSGREDALDASTGVENIKKVIIKPYDKAELASAINVILNRN